MTSRFWPALCALLLATQAACSGGEPPDDAGDLADAGPDDGGSDERDAAARADAGSEVDPCAGDADRASAAFELGIASLVGRPATARLQANGAAIYVAGSEPLRWFGDCEGDSCWDLLFADDAALGRLCPSGRLVWTRPLGGQIELLESSADRVLVSVLTMAPGRPELGASVRALRSSDGMEVWRIAGELTHSAAWTEQGLWAVLEPTGGGERIVRLAPDTGDVEWRFERRDIDDVRIAASDGSLFAFFTTEARQRPRLARLDGSTGDVVWERDWPDDSHIAGDASGDLYVVSPRWGGPLTVSRLAAASGSIVWQTELGLAHYTYQSMSIDGGALVVAAMAQVGVGVPYVGPSFWRVDTGTGTVDLAVEREEPIAQVWPSGAGERVTLLVRAREGWILEGYGAEGAPTVREVRPDPRGYVIDAPGPRLAGTEAGAYFLDGQSLVFVPHPEADR